jgi:hypothetical protein
MNSLMTQSAPAILRGAFSVARRLAIGLALAAAIALVAGAQSAALQNRAFHAEISHAGSYSIAVKETGWQFEGSLGLQAEQIRIRGGVDRLGSYRELVFTYGDGEREGIFRLYERQPVLQCEMRMLRAGANSFVFPGFSSVPAGLYRLGFQPVPHAIYEFGALGSQGPWVLFDSRLRALMISPADHYFIADMQSGPEQMASAIAASVTELPRGFSHRTVFVAGGGVNSTIDSWGRAMQMLSGRRTPSSTADILLRKLSYWTDHGAAYFYDYDPQMGYEGTLQAVKKRFAQLGVPIGSMQLDSWFYPKGKNADWHRAKWTNGVGGAYLYEPDKELFPNGLTAFSRQLGLPFITHARWIDRASPYRHIYRMSGDVIIDPRYWEKTAQWLQAAHVAVYEQDWLGRYAKAEANLADPQMFHDNMAAAMRRHGLTMQYCMAAPADFMQGAAYSNLTTIRTSHDRFDRTDWDMFLYDSRLASALGIWPWTDVFRSSEQANLAMSTLSAGPVGVGDSLSEIDAADLLHAIRSDGVIVKPDLTLRPLDSIYLQDAAGLPGPMIASTWTEFAAQRVGYIFAYARKNETGAKLRPAELGYSGEVYLYNWRNRHGKTVPADKESLLPFQDGWAYYVLSPEGPSGMAFLGDIEQFVTAGRARISAFSDDGSLHIAVAFAPGEQTRTIAIYAPRQPAARSNTKLKQSYDEVDHLLLLTVSASSREGARIEVRLPKETSTGSRKP